MTGSMGITGIKGDTGPPGIGGPHFAVGTAPHFAKDIEDNLYTPTSNAEIRRCQIIWASWLTAKIKEAGGFSDLHAINHWKRFLQEFLEKTKIEPYVSPFTGKIDFGFPS